MNAQGIWENRHKIYEGHLKAFTDDDLRRLRQRIAAIMNEDKYLRMAELAGVTKIDG